MGTPVRHAHLCLAIAFVTCVLSSHFHRHRAESNSCAAVWSKSPYPQALPEAGVAATWPVSSLQCFTQRRASRLTPLFFVFFTSTVWIRLPMPTGKQSDSAALGWRWLSIPWSLCKCSTLGFIPLRGRSGNASLRLRSWLHRLQLQELNPLYSLTQLRLLFATNLSFDTA